MPVKKRRPRSKKCGQNKVSKHRNRVNIKQRGNAVGDKEPGVGSQEKKIKKIKAKETERRVASPFLQTIWRPVYRKALSRGITSFPVRPTNRSHAVASVKPQPLREVSVGWGPFTCRAHKNRVMVSFLLLPS